MLAGTVMLGDLDDFIAPSQSCVNPLFAGTAASSTSGSSAEDPRGVAKISIASDFAAPLSATPLKPNLIRSTEDKVAKVSLNDCLACSGCVTSAETVLLTQQSTEEVLRALKDSVSINDARIYYYRAVLAPDFGAYHADIQGVCCVVFPAVARVNRDTLQFAFDTKRLPEADHVFPGELTVSRKCLLIFRRHIESMLQDLGFSYIVDTTAAANIALRCATEELVQTIQANPEHCSKTTWIAPPTSTAVSATEVSWHAPTASTAPVPRALPILASSCPGWVCYAEKTVPESLGFISKIKSPQQITGICIKHIACKDPAWPAPLLPSEVYHVSVMPCYDKKLEASRKDFTWEDGELVYKEVDCVLSSGEVLALLQSRSVDLTVVADCSRTGCAHATPLDAAMLESPFALNALLCGSTANGSAFMRPPVEEGSSDGFAEYVLRAAAQQLAGDDGTNVVTSVWQRGKNVDFREVTVTCGSVVLRGALAYGFRNIQAVVNKMKRGKAEYHYVEVMACPSGCANGGGQIPATASDQPSDTRWAARSVLELMASCVPLDAFDDPAASLLNSLLPSLLFHTQYHHVPRLETSALKW